MWSTELLANGFNPVGSSSESPLDDLDDINFSLHGVQDRGKFAEPLQAIRDGPEVKALDVWTRFNRGNERYEHINKVQIKQSLSEPSTAEMRKRETSMKDVTDKSTTSPYLLSKQTICSVDITRRSKKEPLGFFIRQGDGCLKRTGIFISRVTKGSLADTGGLLKVGDEILKINEVDIKGYCLTDVVQLIQVPSRLILTLRTVNRCQGNTRPVIYTRHSSPSLMKTQEKDQQKSTSYTKNGESLMAKNGSLKGKQKEQFNDKSNVNEFDSGDLSKNTSTIDELIRLLRAHTEEQNSLKKANLQSDKVSDNTAKKVTIDISNPDGSSSTLTQTNIYEPKKISTITPATTVDLVFDDDDMGAKSYTPTKPHPYHRVSVATPQESVSSYNPSTSQDLEDDKLKVKAFSRSRSSSRGSCESSGGSGSPKPRRRLPSLPTEDEQRKRTESNLQLRMEQKPRRKLPTPPASPILDQRHFGPPSTQRSLDRRQKTLSWGGPESDSLTEIKEIIPDSKMKDTHNNKSDTATNESDSSPDQQLKQGHEQATHNTKRHDKEDQNQPTSRGSVIYRRSQSQYSDFFEQQRHSMLMQTFSSGKSSIASSATPASLSLSLDSRDTEPSKRKLLGMDHLSPPNATVKVKSRDSSPAMRRHTSSSLLFGKSKTVSPALSRSSIESEPGFIVFPDEFKDIDLSCSHAVSGMMKVRILKAANLNTIDKKRHKKICCSVEVDFERKASTSNKKVSKNPTWDEVFEVEIQHGREMSFLCYGSSKKEFDKPIARASFYLTPLVRQSMAHQLVVRLTPEGLLYVELEFTEIKALLKRTQSSKNSGVFGFNLSVTSEQEHSDLPVIIRKCVSEIEKRGLDTVGLYRISGNARKKQAIKAEFEENSHAVDISEENCPDINVVTGTLKDYLRELPEPLITEKMSRRLLDGVEENIEEKDTQTKKGYLSKVLSELPVTNRNTLSFILSHLCRVVRNEENKMDSRNLSVCLAPVLQYAPTNMIEPKDLLGLKTYLKAVEVLIDVWNDVETVERDSTVIQV